jgi:hypothetical protein
MRLAWFEKMITYPAIDELELEIRAGRGVAIIVEGNGYDDDPWFYGQWFNDRAQQVAFFPQNGWHRVVEAVAELRRRCHDMPVYGIVDRDFADSGALDADFATSGVLRTPRYTLENYLLEPGCWAQVFAFIFRRQHGAPDGWDAPDQVFSYVEQAYCDCLALAAHNQVIKSGNERYADRAVNTPVSERSYREHPDALSGIDPVAKLCTWGTQLGATEDLGELFNQALCVLRNGNLATWQEQVSGKYVLSVLHHRFPRLPHSGQFPLLHYLNEYLRACPEPPLDLVRLIERIVQDAGR